MSFTDLAGSLQIRSATTLGKLVMAFNNQDGMSDAMPYRHILRLLRAPATRERVGFLSRKFSIYALGTAALLAATCANATVLWEDYQGADAPSANKVPGPSYNQNSALTQQTLANLEAIAANPANAVRTGTSPTINFTNVGVPAQLCNNSDNSNGNISDSASTGPACSTDSFGQVNYTLVKFTAAGNYTLAVAHDDEVDIDISTNFASVGPNYRNAIYNIPVGRLSGFSTNETTFETIGTFNAGAATACALVRIVWNNRGGKTDLSLQWTTPAAVTQIIPAANLLDPSVAASASGCTAITASGNPPSITLIKSIAGGRVNSADQFTVSINNGATLVAAANTYGSPIGVQATTSPVVVTAGTTYTLTDAMATGSVSALSAYTKAIACTGGTAGGTSPNWTITPSAGSQIVCTITNTGPVKPILAIAKASNGPWTVSQTGATYTLTVTNTATATAATSGVITASDVLPAGITPNWASPTTFGNWSCGFSGQTVTCTSSSVIAIGGTSTIALPVSVGAGAANKTLTNYASIGGGGDAFTTPPTAGANCVPLDHCGSVSTSVGGQANFANLTNTATVTPPTGATNTGASCVAPAAYTLATGVCSSSDTDEVAWNVTVAKTGPGAASVGVPFTYTIGLGNAATTLSGNFGTSAIPAGTTLTISEAIPAGLTVTSTTLGSGASAVTCAPASANGPTTLTCKVTTLTVLASGTAASSNTVSILVNVVATATGNLTNSVSVDPTGGTQPPATTGCSPGTSCASVTTPVTPPVVLTSTKAASSNPLQVNAAGQSYTITIHVSGGPTTAAITLIDPLPSGITTSGAITATGTGVNMSGCPNPGAVDLTGCSIAAGAAVGNIVVTVPINVASATGANGGTNTVNVAGGGDPACTSATGQICDATTVTTGIIGAVADLSISKTDASNIYVPGTAGTYVLIITNHGPSSVAGATVTDALPTGMTLSGPWNCAPAGSCSAASGGAVGGTTVNLSVNLANGGVATVTVPVIYSSTPP
jgi:uncharacterized repeat protein (TIGR01451 family)